MDSMGRERGLSLALVAALISGVSVFLNGVAVAPADPFVYTTLKNIGAFIFLAAAVLAFRELGNFRNLSARQWGMLALIGIIGGSIPFLLFFWGLKLGGAAVSSFIFRSLFIFAGFFGYILLKERPEPKDAAAGALMLIGSALLVPGGFVFGFGQALVLAATLFWALEYTVSRRLMADVHPRVVMVSRMLFGSIILLAFLAATGPLTAMTPTADMLAWLVLASLLLFGFMSAWYSSLKHLQVLTATSILALGGIVTAALNLVFLGKAVSLTDAFGLLLILTGAIAMVSAADFLRAVRKSGELLPGLVK